MVSNCQRSSLSTKITAIFLLIFFTLSEHFSYAFSTIERTSGPVAFPGPLGTIEQTLSGASDKTIYFIQDAHSSIDAQKNIAEMIQQLVDEKGVQTVFEEGYSGPVPSDEYFGWIPNDEKRQHAAYHFLDELLLGGAEYAHILRKKQFRLIGVEDKALYFKNLSEAKTASQSRKAIEENLTSLQSSIRKLIQKNASKEINAWLDLKIKAKQSPNLYAEYLKRMVVANLKNAKRHESKKSALFFQSIFNTDRPNSMQPVAVSTLIREIQSLEKEFLDNHLFAETDRKLIETWEMLEGLQSLNNLELSAQDYWEVRKSLHSLSTPDLARYLANASGQSVIFSRLWEEGIHAAQTFYETARLRDEAVFERLRQEINQVSDSENDFVLVFGGFHRDSLLRHFQTQGYRCILLQPKFSGDDSKYAARYKKLIEADDLMDSSVAEKSMRAANLLLRKGGREQVARYVGLPLPVLSHTAAERNELRLSAQDFSESAFREILEASAEIAKQPLSESNLIELERLQHRYYDFLLNDVKSGNAKRIFSKLQPSKPLPTDEPVDVLARAILISEIKEKDRERYYQLEREKWMEGKNRVASAVDQVAALAKLVRDHHMWVFWDHVMAMRVIMAGIEAGRQGVVDAWSGESFRKVTTNDEYVLSTIRFFRHDDSKVKINGLTVTLPFRRPIDYRGPEEALHMRANLAVGLRTALRSADEILNHLPHVIAVNYRSPKPAFSADGTRLLIPNPPVLELVFANDHPIEDPAVWPREIKNEKLDQPRLREKLEISLFQTGMKDEAEGDPVPEYVTDEAQLQALAFSANADPLEKYQKIRQLMVLAAENKIAPLSRIHFATKKGQEVFAKAVALTDLHEKTLEELLAYQARKSEEGFGIPLLNRRSLSPHNRIQILRDWDEKNKNLGAEAEYRQSLGVKAGDNEDEKRGDLAIQFHFLDSQNQLSPIAKIIRQRSGSGWMVPSKAWTKNMAQLYTFVRLWGGQAAQASSLVATLSPQQRNQFFAAVNASALRSWGVLDPRFYENNNPEHMIQFCIETIAGQFQLDEAGRERIRSILTNGAVPTTTLAAEAPAQSFEAIEKSEAIWNLALDPTADQYTRMETAISEAKAQVARHQAQQKETPPPANGFSNEGTLKKFIEAWQVWYAQSHGAGVQDLETRAANLQKKWEALISFRLWFETDREELEAKRGEMPDLSDLGTDATRVQQFVDRIITESKQNIVRSGLLQARKALESVEADRPSRARDALGIIKETLGDGQGIAPEQRREAELLTAQAEAVASVDTILRDGQWQKVVHMFQKNPAENILPPILEKIGRGIRPTSADLKQLSDGVKQAQRSLTPGVRWHGPIDKIISQTFIHVSAALELFRRSELHSAPFVRGAASSGQQSARSELRLNLQIQRFFIFALAAFFSACALSSNQDSEKLNPALSQENKPQIFEIPKLRAPPSTDAAKRIFSLEAYAQKAGLPLEILRQINATNIEASVVELDPKETQALPQSPTLVSLGNNQLALLDVSGTAALLCKSEKDRSLADYLLRTAQLPELPLPIIFIFRSATRKPDLRLVFAHEFSHLPDPENEFKDFGPINTRHYLKNPYEIKSYLTEILIFRLMNPISTVRDFIRAREGWTHQEMSDKELDLVLSNPSNALPNLYQALWQFVDVVEFRGLKLKATNLRTVREAVMQMAAPLSAPLPMSPGKSVQTNSPRSELRQTSLSVPNSIPILSRFDPKTRMTRLFNAIAYRKQKIEKEGMGIDKAQVDLAQILLSEFGVRNQKEEKQFLEFDDINQFFSDEAKRPTRVLLWNLTDGPTGSFKDYTPILLYHKVWSAIRQRQHNLIPHEVVVVSTGNHAIANAQAVQKAKDYFQRRTGEELKIRLVVYMGEDAAPHKVAMVKDLGATVIQTRPDGHKIKSYREAEDIVEKKIAEEVQRLRRTQEKNPRIIQTRHADPFVVAGYSVPGREMAKALKKIFPRASWPGDGVALISPMGSGGLITGLSELQAEMPEIKTFGASADPAALTYQSLLARFRGSPHALVREDVPANIWTDGNAATPEAYALSWLQHSLEDALLVPDESTVPIISLLRDHGINAEATTALPLVSFLLHREKFKDIRTIILPITSAHQSEKLQEELRTKWPKSEHLISDLHRYYAGLRMESRLRTHGVQREIPNLLVQKPGRGFSAEEGAIFDFRNGGHIQPATAASILEEPEMLLPQLVKPNESVAVSLTSLTNTTLFADLDPCTFLVIYVPETRKIYFAHTHVENFEPISTLWAQFQKEAHGKQAYAFLAGGTDYQKVQPEIIRKIEANRREVISMIQAGGIPLALAIPEQGKLEVNAFFDPVNLRAAAYVVPRSELRLDRTKELFQAGFDFASANIDQILQEYRKADSSQRAILRVFAAAGYQATSNRERFYWAKSLVALRMQPEGRETAKQITDAILAGFKENVVLEGVFRNDYLLNLLAIIFRRERQSAASEDLAELANRAEAVIREIIKDEKWAEPILKMLPKVFEERGGPAVAEKVYRGIFSERPKLAENGTKYLVKSMKYPKVPVPATQMLVLFLSEPVWREWILRGGDQAAKEQPLVTEAWKQVRQLAGLSRAEIRSAYDRFYDATDAHIFKQGISGFRISMGTKRLNQEGLKAFRLYAYLYAKDQASRLGKKEIYLPLAHDPRPSWRAVRRAVIQGIRLAEEETGVGIHLEDLGLITTPMAVLAVDLFQADGGIIITASHNEPSDNGLKFLSSFHLAADKPGPGALIGEAQINRIVRSFQKVRNSKALFEKLEHRFSSIQKVEEERINPEKIREIRKTYLNFLKKQFPFLNSKLLSQLKVLIDTNGGAGAGKIGSEDSGHLVWVLRELGLDVLDINPEIGVAKHAVEPKEKGPALDQIQHELARLKRTLGVVFDWDADRGTLDQLTPQEMSAFNVAMILAAIKAYPGLYNYKPNQEIVVIAHSSASIRIEETVKLFQSAGMKVRVRRVAVGEPHVLKAMKEEREQGHLVPIGVEAANGGTIYGKALFRDGTATLLLSASALVDPKIYQTWYQIAGKSWRAARRPSFRELSASVPHSIEHLDRLAIHRQNQAQLKRAMKQAVEAEWRKSRAQSSSPFSSFKSYELQLISGTQVSSSISEKKTQSWNLFLEHKDGTRAHLEFRVSNTEPIVRYLVDAEHKKDFDALQQWFTSNLKSAVQQIVKRSELRRTLGFFEERLRQGKFTLEGEMSPPLEGNADSAKRYDAAIAQSARDYNEGFAEATTMRDAPELPEWFVSMMEKIHDASNPKKEGFFVRLGKKELVNRLWNHPRSWLYRFRTSDYGGLVVELMSEFKRYEDPRKLSSAPENYVATIASQVRSEEEIQDRILDAVNRLQAKQLFVVSGSHPLRKLARIVLGSDMESENAIYPNILTTLKIIEKLKREGRISPEIRVSASWDLYKESDLDRLKIKIKALKAANPQGAKPVIYAQMPFPKGRFMHQLWEAARAGFFQEVDFKVSFMIVDSAKTLRKCLYLAGVNPYQDPEAMREIALWEHYEARGGSSLDAFRVRWNAGYLNWIKDLPGITGVRYVSISSKSREITRTVLEQAGLNPADRLADDKRAPARRDIFRPWITRMAQLPLRGLSYARVLEEPEFAARAGVFLNAAAEVLETISKEPGSKEFFSITRFYFNRIRFAKQFRHFREAFSLRPVEDGSWQEIAVNLQPFLSDLTTTPEQFRAAFEARVREIIHGNGRYEEEMVYLDTKPVAYSEGGISRLSNFYWKSHIKKSKAETDLTPSFIKANASDWIRRVKAAGSSHPVYVELSIAGVKRARKFIEEIYSQASERGEMTLLAANPMTYVFTDFSKPELDQALEDLRFALEDPEFARKVRELGISFEFIELDARDVRKKLETYQGRVLTVHATNFYDAIPSDLYAQYERVPYLVKTRAAIKRTVLASMAEKYHFSVSEFESVLSRNEGLEAFLNSLETRLQPGIFEDFLTQFSNAIFSQDSYQAVDFSSARHSGTEAERYFQELLDTHPRNVWAMDSRVALHSISQLFDLLHPAGVIQMTQFSATLRQLYRDYEGLRKANTGAAIIMPLMIDLVEKMAEDFGFQITNQPFSDFDGKSKSLATLHIEKNVSRSEIRNAPKDLLGTLTKYLTDFLTKEQRFPSWQEVRRAFPDFPEALPQVETRALLICTVCSSGLVGLASQIFGNSSEGSIATHFFHFEKTACLGSCAFGPVMYIGELMHGQLSAEQDMILKLANSVAKRILRALPRSEMRFELSPKRTEALRIFSGLFEAQSIHGMHFFFTKMFDYSKTHRLDLNPGNFLHLLYDDAGFQNHVTSTLMRLNQSQQVLPEEIWDVIRAGIILESILREDNLLRLRGEKLKLKTILVAFEQLGQLGFSDFEIFEILRGNKSKEGLPGLPSYVTSILTDATPRSGVAAIEAIINTAKRKRSLTRTEVRTAPHLAFADTSLNIHRLRGLLREYLDQGSVNSLRHFFAGVRAGNKYEQAATLLLEAFPDFTEEGNLKDERWLQTLQAYREDKKFAAELAHRIAAWLAENHGHKRDHHTHAWYTREILVKAGWFELDGILVREIVHDILGRRQKAKEARVERKKELENAVLDRATLHRRYLSRLVASSAHLLIAPLIEALNERTPELMGELLKELVHNPGINLEALDQAIKPRLADRQRTCWTQAMLVARSEMRQTSMPSENQTTVKQVDINFGDFVNHFSDRQRAEVVAEVALRKEVRLVVHHADPSNDHYSDLRDLFAQRIFGGRAKLTAQGPLFPTSETKIIHLVLFKNPDDRPSNDQRTLIFGYQNNRGGLIHEDGTLGVALNAASGLNASELDRNLPEGVGFNPSNQTLYAKSPSAASFARLREMQMSVAFSWSA